MGVFKMNNNENIKIGVCGCGGIARNVHIPQIAESSNGVVKALCDTNRDKMLELRKKYNVDENFCFTDYKRMISHPEIDAISICTENDSHVKIALECTENKKPYAIEKPVAVNEKEAKILFDKTIKINLPHIVCFSYRYKPAARLAKKIISEGALGEIVHVYAQYFQAWALSEDLPLIWRLQKNRSGSGALADLGSHMIDLTRFLTGKEFTRLTSKTGNHITERLIPESNEYGSVDVDDYCHILADLESNISGVFEISRCGTGRGNYQRVEIYGTKGGLVYNLNDENSLELCLDKYQMESKEYHKIKIPEMYNSNQMQSFIDIICNDGDGLSASIKDGYICQRILDAVLASSVEKKWVDL